MLRVAVVVLMLKRIATKKVLVSSCEAPGRRGFSPRGTMVGADMEERSIQRMSKKLETGVEGVISKNGGSRF